jgi:hypothetical protein
MSIMAVIEILDNLRKVFSFIAIISTCKYRYFDLVETFFNDLKGKILGLNHYQLESLEG